MINSSIIKLSLNSASRDRTRMSHSKSIRNRESGAERRSESDSSLADTSQRWQRGRGGGRRPRPRWAPPHAAFLDRVVHTYTHEGPSPSLSRGPRTRTVGGGQRSTPRAPPPFDLHRTPIRGIEPELINKFACAVKIFNSSTPFSTLYSTDSLDRLLLFFFVLLYFFFSKSSVSKSS